MRNRDWLKTAAGAVVFATVIYVILAAPGLLDDRDSVTAVTRPAASTGP